MCRVSGESTGRHPNLGLHTSDSPQNDFITLWIQQRIDSSRKETSSLKEREQMQRFVFSAHLTKFKWCHRQGLCITRSQCDKRLTLHIWWFWTPSWGPLDWWAGYCWWPSLDLPVTHWLLNQKLEVTCRRLNRFTKDRKCGGCRWHNHLYFPTSKNCSITLKTALLTKGKMIIYKL